MALTSRQDYILRMIEQIIQVLVRVIGLAKAGDHNEALAQLETATGLLLGPFAAVLPRLDSASAAQMLGNPDQLLAYARLIDAEAKVRRLMGAAAAADVLNQRALELALEANARGASDRRGRRPDRAAGARRSPRAVERAFSGAAEGDSRLMCDGEIAWTGEGPLPRSLHSRTLPRFAGEGRRGRGWTAWDRDQSP